ncbi:tryptophan-tRNA ligase, mitochondrial-like protein [Euroglyphus maynei]|uniref:tryptophan--tRNA ligase n=1 Tax=Euroglyphus maynei TaxID=6958 RepID=A0A1Y3B546_EURMA|nr:tryptophan-tRNA ligase, mitochondrial-like protein [Euroglyphus maynei]
MLLRQRSWIKLIKVSSLRIHYDHRILSGIQPTGSIHLGNYFGAIKQWVDLQQPQLLSPLIESEKQKNDESIKYEPIYLPPIFQIVDLHSLTMSNNPDKLRENVLEITALLIGCGIDPNRCLLFKQSSVPYHGYLCWILTTLTTLPQLHRFPQFKEKSANFKDPPTGLFLYPVLQTADILLYKGTHIPVGDDQLAHINLTKHISAKFNNTFKRKVFPIPLELVSKSGAGRIKNLRAPERKMSKSDADTKSRIELTDNSDEIVRKIRKAVTDMKSEVTYDPENRPGVSNLVQIYSLISDMTVEQVCRHFDGKSTFEFKIELGDRLAEYLRPIRMRIIDHKNNRDYLEAVLKDGSSKAIEIAEKTIDEVKLAVGLNFSS